jgi:NTP pyrophosphatase (non-canonical NTP hydrolase)
MQKKIHQNAVDHGWWDGVRTIPELLVLLHSEVSEALEAYRNNDRENYREELADIAIRLLDTAEGQGIDLTAEIIRKHERNISREYKYGGKLL